MGRFILRKGRPRKDGKVSLTFSGYANGHRIFAGTGISIRPADWDDVRQQVRRADPSYARINATLRDIQARFDHEVASLDVVSAGSVERLKRELSRRGGEFNSGSDGANMTFWSGYDAFITSKATDRGERTIAKYQTLQGILRQFEGGYGKLTFACMTHDFYDAFKKFLIEGRGLTNNTVGKYVSTLKTYLSWAEERGVEVPKQYRKFKVDEEDVEVIALSMAEVRRLTELVLIDRPRLARVRDLFLFACYTGARFGDVQRLHLDDVRGSVWYLRMGKTKSETRIHLVPQATVILERYRKEGSLPKISSQRMNDYLKELGRLAGIDEPVRIARYQGAKRIDDRGPKWQFLSTHVARRTFVTISLERGMRPEVVMSFTGHRSFKTMKKYIALTENNRAEAMHIVWGE